MTDETAPEPFIPVDEDWDRALCVVAHPDDLEFGAAAAVARWTDQGKTVVYAMVTSGEAGIDAMSPDECRVVREAEQVESGRIVGVDVVEFLGQRDGVLEYGVGLREVICAAVRRHQPEIVITEQLPGDLGWPVAQPGRPHRRRGGHPRRRPRRREPVGLPRPDRRRAASLGRGQAGVGGGVAGQSARRRHHGVVRSWGGVPGGPSRLHRRTRLGALRSRGVPGGCGPTRRHPARCAEGDDVRGVLDGLG